MTTPAAVESFLHALLALPAWPNVFNPWRDHDAVHDGVPGAPEIRTDQLRRYLVQRLGTARVVLVAEAPSHRGAKYCGIAMTSERILLGHKPQVPAAGVLQGGALQTSRSPTHPRGSNESTATIVWTQMSKCGLAPDEFVLWNAFPCHPHKPANHLSNRRPSPAEVAAAAHVLPQFLGLFPGASHVVAVGDVAKDLAATMGLHLPGVRHPSFGGAPRFRAQLADILSPPAP